MSHVASALRLRGGGPKKRCGRWLTTTERCSQVSLRIVGDCTFCETSFCGRHRLPEGAFFLRLSDRGR